MLRPATPLAVLFFVAFAFLLLSCLSTPVINGLSLAEYDGTRFGVWGYCVGSKCSNIEVGYSIAELDATRDHFSIDEETRHNVSYILIVHPIACFFSFVCFLMALAAHWHSPGHSPRFLMTSFLMTIPALLAALLAFLIDILLFIPHLSAASWLVLASVILLLLGSIVSCGMRRTLISRKARRKRIAENAEMNGENYYAQQNLKNSLNRADSPAPLSGASGSPTKEKAAVFGSYESANTTVLGDSSTYSQPNNVVRALNLDASRNQGYDRPTNVNQLAVETNPYANSVPLDYYNQGSVAPQGSNPYNGESQYRNRGGLTSPTHAYSQQRGGKMGGPPQYGYDSPARAPRPNTYNYGNGGRGGASGPSRDMRGPLEEINPYQANITDLAARNNFPTPGYQTSGQRQPVLYSDRANPTDSTIQDSQSEPPTTVPVSTSPSQPPVIGSPSRAPTPKSATYIEDVDPRFAEPAMPLPHPQPIISMVPMQNRPFRSRSNPSTPAPYGFSDIPNLPDPFRSPQSYAMDRSQAPFQRDMFNRNHASLRPPPAVGYESRKNQSLDSLSLQEGQRSPATSDGSHFTSISQRGINPNWRPNFAPKSPLNNSHNNRRRRPSREQVLLDSNPDFMLPQVRGGHGGNRMRGAAGRGRGIMIRGGIRRASSLPRGASSLPQDSFGFSGLVRDGRYPAPP